MTNKNYHPVSLNIFSILYSSSEGFTWKDIQVILNERYNSRVHHGTISGALTNMHKSLDIFRLKLKRDNCYIYVHGAFRNQYKDELRTDYPKSRNKWKEVADLLYIAMTEEDIPADAWDNAIEAYEALQKD